MRPAGGRAGGMTGKVLCVQLTGLITDCVYTREIAQELHGPVVTHSVGRIVQHELLIRYCRFLMCAGGAR